MKMICRSERRELLDEEEIPEKDLQRNLVELDIINRFLGGHKITLEGVKQLAGMDAAQRVIRERPLHICEIGCGGGDNLQAIDRWAFQKGIPIRITGVDMKVTCTQFARAKSWHHPVCWITKDYREAEVGAPDIVFSSLFCHHFPDDVLPDILRWMYANGRCGFFINDLHRHPLAYYSIKWLTKAFSKSYLVRHDAPLSVQRAFVRKDWTCLLSQAGLSGGSVRWKWAFRWLIVVPHR